MYTCNISGVNQCVLNGVLNYSACKTKGLSMHIIVNGTGISLACMFNELLVSEYSQIPSTA